jgi:hypothetical protein
MALQGMRTRLVRIGLPALVLLSGWALSLTSETWAWRLVRGAALLGYSVLFVTIVSSLVARQIGRRLGMSYMDIHHTWAAAAISLLTLHPLLVALNSYEGLRVFVPRTDSTSEFFRQGGRPAFYLVLIASTSAAVRKAIGRKWLNGHMLSYAALVLGTIHANLIGTDFQSLVPRAISLVMSVFVVAIFVKKRLPSTSR